MDPYKLLELPKNFTLEQLKHNYKRIALRVHPDKSKLPNDYLFKLVTQAYKALLKEHERRQAEKQHNQLKTGFETFSDRQRVDTPVKVQTGNNFNVERFNQVFEEHKIEDAVDEGYGNWMYKSDPRREDISLANNLGTFERSKFNTMFDNQSTTSSKKVIVYKEPDAIPSTKKIQFAELGVTKVGDFSADNTTLKKLNYTDYKIAHTTNKLVDPQAMQNRKEYRNHKELELERSNISYQLSEKENRRLALKKAKEEEREKKRQEEIARRDQLAFAQYEKLNKLLLGR